MASRNITPAFVKNIVWVCIAAQQMHGLLPVSLIVVSIIAQIQFTVGRPRALE